MDESYQSALQSMRLTLRSVILNVKSRSLLLDVLARLWQDLVRAWLLVVELRIDVLISDIARAAAGGR